MLCPSGVTAARWNRRPTFCARARLRRFTASLCDVNKTHSIHYFLLLCRHKKRSSVGPLTAINSTCRLRLGLAAQTIAPVSRSRAVVHLWWSSSGFSERPPVRSATKIDAASSMICFWSHNSRSASPWGGFGFDILTHSCRPFGWRVCRASSGRVGREPAALRLNWQRYRI